MICTTSTYTNKIETETIESFDNFPGSSSFEHILDQENEPPVIRIPESPKEKERKKKRPTSTYVKRNEILVEMKDDFKKYYKEKLNLEKEKLEDRRKRTKLFEQLAQKGH
ncbi:hypothetical protein QE152_g5021 [Popillia japonica]|uniref:Uncharacterized protein n=1 Tax=Popillia japonica TaxID=7064 RepID=A0AAW1MYK9_POPJA